MNTIEIAKVATDRASDAVAVDAAHTGDNSRADYLADVAARAGLYVAYSEKAPVGFACLDDQYFFRKPFVSLLVVHPDHRRRGNGSRLMAHLESEAVGERLFTSTNASNAPMVSLLRKNGFRQCGHVRGLDEDDAELLFSKDFKREEERTPRP